MNRKVNLILIAVLCGLLQVTYGQTCKKCLTTSEAYCVDDTTFYFCVDGNPLTETLQTCEKDHVCTDSENICEPKVKADGTTTVPACSTSCGRCPDTAAVNKRYTCVSKTQFGRCVNGAVTLVSSCATGTYCSAELYAENGHICASQCVGEFFGVSATCNNDEITTTTTTADPGTTPSVESLKDQCIAGRVPNAKYFYVRNTADSECKSYIYCEPYEKDQMDAYLIKCSSGYFDSTTSRCVETKPAECNAVEEITTTESPATAAPTTEASATGAPTTEASATAAPTTEASATAAPTTEVPATEASTTEAPKTEIPTSQGPETQ